MRRVQVVGLAAAVVGAAVSTYLTVLHYAGVVPGCPITGPINCDAVLTSPYSVLAGTAVPTSAAGIVWFAISAALWMRPLGWVQLAWSAIGLLTALYLVFLEIVRIGAICLWCSAAHLLVVFIFIAALFVVSRQRAY